MKRIILALLTLPMIATFLYTNTRNEKVISTNVAKEVELEETQISDELSNASKLLSEEKYEEARDAYDEVINLDKENKELYYEIINEYVEEARWDDAYYIARKALINDVDSNNMQDILNSITDNFDTIILTPAIYQNEEYQLPAEVIAEVNGEDKVIEINWKGAIVDTSYIGTLTFEGVNDEYGKKVDIILNIEPEEPDVIEEKVCYIDDIYMSGDYIYIDVEEVKYYIGDEALQYAMEDMSPKVYEEDNKYYLIDGYYIRETGKKETYKVINNSELYLNKYDVQADSEEEDIRVNYDEFKKYIDSYKDNPVKRARLASISIKNGDVTKICRVFTP